jgi:hypothetical protein
MITSVAPERQMLGAAGDLPVRPLPGTVAGKWLAQAMSPPELKR